MVKLLKTYFLYLYRVTVLLLPVILLTACHREGKKFLIGVSQCSIDEWRNKQNREMESEAFYHGVDIDIRSVKDDSRKQVQDIRHLMDEGVDLLIISPNSADEITPVVEEAYNRGIPVILMERKIDSEKYTAFIGADNYKIGKEAGKYVAYLLNGKGTVFEVQGLNGSTSANERHKGFTEALRDFPNIRYAGFVYARWYENEAGVKMDSVWKAHPQIDAVFAQNDRMAKGVYASAVRNRRDAGLKLVGIDGLSGVGYGVDEVLKKHLTATFIYPTNGDKVIALAMQILEHKPFKRVTELSTAVINDGNVHLIDYENKQMVAQEERIKVLNGRIDNYFSILNRQEVIFWSLGFILLTSITFLVFMIQAYRAKDKLNMLEKVQNRKILKQKEQVEEQRDRLAEMSRQLEQATHAKLIFFTNVSHDFRTPLTLISSPVEELMGDKSLSSKQHYLVSVAYKNVKVLLQLINELLDFRRYENGKMEMDFRKIPLADSVSEWSRSFALQAQKQHIRFEVVNHLAEPGMLVLADGEKLERILFNLLSNAFKFTPANGTVQVRLSSTDREAVIEVYDSGKGIPKEKLSKIFDRFFTESVHHNGSGIGLALTKTFVELHHGTITAESEGGKGCTFIVRLPLTAFDADQADAIYGSSLSTRDSSANLALDAEDVSPLDDSQDDPYNDNSNKPSVLVIDDNKDICSYLYKSLSDDYQVRYALDGKSGLRLAVKLVPDLIVCDVMMPDMDGFECCSRLKKELQTSHIPVILLTACSLDEQRIKGFEHGADSYIPKPFSLDVLKARIQNLIENRHRLKAVFSENGGFSLKHFPSSAATPDDTFLRRLNALISKKMGDSSFNVDNMADEMNMSRVQLYRKVKALCNYTPVEVLKIMRLRAAERLLVSTEKSISEVAYEVGFTSPSYFTKCYKAYYGKNPTDNRVR